MPDLSKKLSVHLSLAYRTELEAICRRQSVGVGKVRRARVLLMSDADHPNGRRRDWEIAEAVGVSERQVVRIRQQFVREGETVLDRKPRSGVVEKSTVLQKPSSSQCVAALRQTVASGGPCNCYVMSWSA